MPRGGVYSKVFPAPASGSLPSPPHRPSLTRRPAGPPLSRGTRERAALFKIHLPPRRGVWPMAGEAEAGNAIPPRRRQSQKRARDGRKPLRRAKAHRAQGAGIVAAAIIGEEILPFPPGLAIGIRRGGGGKARAIALEAR